MREWKTELARAVCHEIFRVEECSEVRFSQLCTEIAVFKLVAGFYAFVILCCCVVSEPVQQKHQS